MNLSDQARRLQERGIRPTPQRLAVYDYLLTHRTHPTADAIFEALSPQYPSFSRTTIYNSVKALMDAGLVRVVTIDPSEQHFDGDPLDHGHCRCEQCGRLFDFEMPDGLLAPLIPEGFTVNRQDIFFSGLCQDCR
ncbi:MAG: transcriptional repressor [Clostridia bacterium]|nr:transcriptional repressor [Clostridia bacterium]